MTTKRKIREWITRKKRALRVTTKDELGLDIFALLSVFPPFSADQSLENDPYSDARMFKVRND